MKHSSRFLSSAQFAGLGVAVTVGLAACGGGSSPGTSPTSEAPAITVAAPVPALVPAPAPTTLKGTVAVGAALAGASITVKDSDASTADVTVVAGIDGSYSADVSLLKTPLVISATGTLNGDPVALVAVVASLTNNSNNTANVTSLTNAIAVLLAPSGNTFALNTPATLATVTPAQVSSKTALLVDTLRSDPETSAALGTNFSPLTTAFVANGLGIDSVLDRLDIVTNSAGVSITNLAAPATNDGQNTTVSLTSATATAPVLAASLAASTLPTAAEMLALAKKFEACFALPIAQRVTVDAVGSVTAVSSTCNFVPATYKSSGRTWQQDTGQFTLTRDHVTNSKAGTPNIALVLPAPNTPIGNQFQHPFCNTTTCVVMNIPFVSASGKSWSSNWTLAKVAGVWNYVGNQRPYRLQIENRLYRKTELNPTSQFATATNSYSYTDRYEAVLRPTFDLTVGDTAKVRAVRWTGPGLPAAGLVQHRSQACTTDDRMAISNQEGLLHVAGNPASLQSWTYNTNIDYLLSAAKLDGTTLARPVPSATWATSPNVANSSVAPTALLTNIASWALYKAEIFYYTNVGATADEIIYARADTPYEPASAGALKQWPLLGASFVDSYLKPTGANQGVISSLGQVMPWANPVGGYVGSAYLFSSNSVSATNTENETASYLKRSRIDFGVDSFGDSSANAREFSSAASGTSLSSFTSSSGNNPNPRCGDARLPEILNAPTAVNATIVYGYREVGLIFRGQDRKVYSDVTIWRY